MENDENTFETEEEIQDGELDFSDETESADESSEEQSQTEELTTEQKLAKAQAEANKWRRLAQKGVKGKENKTPAPTQPSQQGTVDVDERIIKSQGMPDELLTELKAVAQVRGVTLIDAQSDPLFVAMKEKHDREQRQKKASLGASRGSGTPAPKADLNTPNLSREEHKKLALEAMPKL